MKTTSEIPRIGVTSDTLRHRGGWLHRRASSTFSNARRPVVCVTAARFSRVARARRLEFGKILTSRSCPPGSQRPPDLAGIVRGRDLGHDRARRGSSAPERGRLEEPLTRRGASRASLHAASSAAVYGDGALASTDDALVPRLSPLNYGESSVASISGRSRPPRPHAARVGGVGSSTSRLRRAPQGSAGERRPPQVRPGQGDARVRLFRSHREGICEWPPVTTGVDVSDAVSLMVRAEEAGRGGIYNVRRARVPRPREGRLRVAGSTRRIDYVDTPENSSAGGFSTSQKRRWTA